MVQKQRSILDLLKPFHSRSDNLRFFLFLEKVRYHFFFELSRK